jgi:hypothetical protein
MCIIYTTIYPCSHTVLLAYEPCAPGAHPQKCNPHNCETRVVTYDDNSTIIPSDCPCHKGPFAFTGFPIDPDSYAEHCLRNGIGIESATAMIPAWMMDADGVKKGSRSMPWRVFDYVVAHQAAKNRKAIGSMGLGDLPSYGAARKRRAGEATERAAKKVRVDSGLPSDESTEKLAAAAAIAIKHEGYRMGPSHAAVVKREGC